MAIVYRQDVARYLGVTVDTLLTWQKRGYLSPGRNNTYDTAQIDAFLAGCRQTLTRPLTWEDLVTGAVRLTTAEVERKRFNLTFQRFPQFCERMGVEWIRYPGTDTNYRYSLYSLHQAEANLETPVSARFAQSVAGFKGSISEFLGATGIKTVYNPWATTSDRVHVQEASFHAFLRSRLPDWIEPEDWIDDCKEAIKPLRSPKEAAALLGIQARTHLILDELRSRQALYIHYGQSVLVLAEWLDAQMEADRVLSAGEVARAFMVHPNTPTTWAREGTFTCPVDEHQHPPGELYFWRSCWLAYLRLNCAPSIEPRMGVFLRARLKPRPTRLYTPDDLAKECGWHRERIYRQLREGQLPCVRLPGGHVRFTRAWLHRAKIQLTQ